MRAISTSLRGLAFLGVLAALPVAARAADLAQEVGELAAAVDSRLGGDASGKEAKKLTQATKKLAKLTGKEIAAKDLRKVLTAVYVSKTTDATVLAEAQDVLDGLRGLVISRREDADGFLDELVDKYRDKLVKKLATAQRKLDDANALADSNPKKASVLLEVAYVKFQAAAKKGQRWLDLLNRVPSKVGITAVLTGNNFQVRFQEWAATEHLFGQVSVWGCTSLKGSEACKEIVAIGFPEPPPGYAGWLSVMELSYTATSEPAGGGVQDLYWGATSSSLTIVESTPNWIKGRFSGTLESFDGQPSELHITGTFAIKRK